MKVLIVKLSSMGDVVHTLPAVTDAVAQLPDLDIDWVVDRAFAEIPHWHTHPIGVFTSAHRQWKRQPIRAFAQGQILEFSRRLRANHYDLVIDAQASLKSAVISRLAKAKARAGMDGASVREYGAHYFYHHRYSIDKSQHAITRIRHLFAAALGYSVPNSAASFGIARQHLQQPKLTVNHPYLLCVPNASWNSKLYPESHWQTLIMQASKEFSVLLPWGNEQERQRAQRLCVNNPRASVLPRMRLSELAYLIQGAKGVISVDTGLGHLAAALSVPALSLYGPTNPRLIGTQGEHQGHLQAPLECVPCYQRQCRYQRQAHSQPVCLQRLSPQQVWQRVIQLI